MSRSKNSPHAVEIPPHKRPQQARAKVTYNKVVAAAQEILEREGASALNTNYVAEKAGISIGTLYHYFPNKETIVYAICQDWLEAAREVVDLEAALAWPAQDFDAYISDLMARAMKVDSAQASTMALIQTRIMVGKKNELADLFQQHDNTTVTSLTQILRHFGSTLSSAELRTISICALNSYDGRLNTIAMLDFPEDTTIIDRAFMESVRVILQQAM